ncbi:MAG: cation-translocating P-type ATPase, partial [Pseudoalteromonas tetraodonis]|nr:cation-translocating P-type ATPase [Pseudoalteromonas tetraodonis]
DGILVKGSTSVDESMMTGEHQPVRKYIDHNVYAGTVNHDGIIEIKINKLGQNTLLNQIIRLQHNALTKRPRLVEITDKVAQWFVAVLLVFASLTAIGWYQIDPDVAFWITISVLVATCPCALSLAIPTALTCAVATLTRKGILIKQAHVLETLSKLTLVAFDKTGTLTQGKFSLDVVDILDDNYSKEQILDIAAQLESYSEHPIASAFKEFKGQRKFDGVQLHPGVGISAQYDNTHYAIGKSGWFDTKKTNAQATLYINKQPVARFYFIDKVKTDADKLINSLKAANLSCHMLTGDASAAGAKVAKKLKLDSVQSNCSPKDKQVAVERWSTQGEVVAMVGDGVNDSPVFASAHLSIAMETGADISKNSADVVLLNSDLASIDHLLTIAKQTRRIIKQNLALSLLYNGSILPLAAMGLVAPWMAVIGMSASSIIVICNSLRLLKL